MTSEEFINIREGDEVIRTFGNYQSPVGYKTKVFFTVDGEPRIRHLDGTYSSLIPDRWDVISKKVVRSKSGFASFVTEKGL